VNSQFKPKNALSTVDFNAGFQEKLSNSLSLFPSMFSAPAPQKPFHPTSSLLSYHNESGLWVYTVSGEMKTETIIKAQVSDLKLIVKWKQQTFTDWLFYANTRASPNLIWSGNISKNFNLNVYRHYKSFCLYIRSKRFHLRLPEIFFYTSKESSSFIEFVECGEKST
jgi:hypothetical protein